MRASTLAGAVLAAAVLLSAAVPAQAQTVLMTANLSGSNEAPTKVLTGAFGTATVTVNMSTQTVSWVIEVFNMPSGTTAAHFHVGGPDVSGPVVVNIPVTTNISNDYTVTGSATASNLTVRGDQGIRSWDDFLQALVGGQVYINVHSAVNAPGEIRGQVVRVP